MNRRSFIQSLLAIIPASLFSLGYGDYEYKYPWDAKGPKIYVTREGPLKISMLEDMYQQVTYSYDEPSLLIMGRDHHRFLMNYPVRFFPPKNRYKTIGEIGYYNNAQIAYSKSMRPNESVFINEKFREDEKYNISLVTT